MLMLATLPAFRQSTDCADDNSTAINEQTSNGGYSVGKELIRIASEWGLLFS